MWILDIGATCHLTSRVEWIKDYKPLEHPFPVRLGNNGVEYALGHGIAHPELSDGNDIEVNEVYYIPNITKNLISINKLTNDNMSVEFYHKYCIIPHKTPSGRGYVVNCPSQGCLYLLGRSVVHADEAHHIDDSNTSNYVTFLWHYRLGHVNHQTMVHMDRQHIALGFTLPHKLKLSLCEGCIFGKISNLPFPSHPTMTTKPLQLQ